MTTMHLGTLSPTEDDNQVIDLKQATFQVTPVGTVTPSLTPTSPPNEEIMAGRKLYSLEKPDDRAKELAAKLTLEEQVRPFPSLRWRSPWTFLQPQIIYDPSQNLICSTNIRVTRSLLCSTSSIMS